MYKTKIVPKITSKQEHRHKEKGYRRSHILGDTAEIKEFGLTQFNRLNREIQRLPKGHWAATHSLKGNIKISQELLDLIPQRLRAKSIKELKVHEIAEFKA